MLSRTDAENAAYSAAIHAYGLARCEAVWLCPVCAFAIRTRRAREIEAVLRAARTRGWGAAVGILTVPHEVEPLGEVWDRLAHLWAYLNDGKGAAGWTGRFRARHGIIGFLWCDEVTWSAVTGWHPHRHLLILTDRPCTAATAKEIGAAIRGRAAQWADRTGLSALASEAMWFAPVDFRRAGALATYLAGATRRKTGAEPRPFLATTEAELHEREASERFNPFDLLAGITDAAHPAARLWAEYETTTHGRASWRWSTGPVSQPRNRSQTGRAQGVSSRETQNAEVSGADWAQLVSPYPGREDRLKRAMDVGGEAGVRDQLDAWRAHLDTSDAR